MNNLRSYFINSFVVTYKTELPKFNRTNAIKIGDTKIYKKDLEDMLSKDVFGSELDKRAMQSLINQFPNSLNLSLYIEKNTPRIFYLVTNEVLKLKSNKISKDLVIHPMSVLTLNNWIYINRIFERALSENNIKANLIAINSYKADHLTYNKGKLDLLKQGDLKNNQGRIGANYLKFVAIPDNKWVDKYRKQIFDSDLNYESYKTLTYNASVNTQTKKLNYDELYREATRRAEVWAIKSGVPRNSEEFENMRDRIFVQLKSNTVTENDLNTEVDNY